MSATILAFTSTVLSLGVASVDTSSAVAGRYQLVDAPGALYVLLEPKESSLFGFLAHEHVVEARGYTGSVMYDPAQPEACSIEVTVPVSGLVVDRPEFRAEVGIEGGISDGDRKTVAEHMRREDQLDAKTYDTIQFSGGDCTPLENRPGMFRVTGGLTIRGVEKKIQVPVRVRFEGRSLVAESDFSEVHDSFGFEPYSAFAGTVQNAPMIRFRVRVRATRPGAEPEPEG